MDKQNNTKIQKIVKQHKLYTLILNFILFY